ncbi:RNP domain protein [Talaromyces stipitatus ATCC 10500]|uniref:RNP domain protein n=1 Tax=Talaromyces stipitatus (strain ATCC 10500 / CBS 375.48 / QM 6759 / NRRL 1006) TaxID=441959 RepID=B8M375_TALSN|nr:RNP domain protein [Talaromyces stipitatus ATCC 10500]EED22051.1 RNP domain protein [Talaromyces stipitatus ATCC 10500]
MSLPPPPGLSKPSSLPPRPPSSFKPAYSSAPSYSSPGTTTTATPSHGARASPATTGYSAFTAFAPRAVASAQPYRSNSPAVAAVSQPTTAYQGPAVPGYSAPTYQNPQQSYQAGAQSYYGQQPGYGDSQYGASPIPQIANPFPVPGQERKGYGRDSGMDPEMEAQIAQWQSAYMTNPNEDSPATITQAKAAGRPGASAPSSTNSGTPTYSASASHTPVPRAGGESESKTVIRSGGGQTWSDPTLLEWDPAHFRLFVGNLAGEVTDDSLKKAFSRYPSIQKARVIRDKRTEKSKGYGFVSFSDGDDYFKAAREMQGKYIGSHPVLLRRAMTEVRPVQDKRDKKGKKNGHGGGGGNKNSPHGTVGGGKHKGDGVKKQGYTRVD